MGFSVAQMYPGAFTPDVNFVDGKYKNSSAPGVYDGTPLDSLLFNQNLALFDALMLEANLTYNNSADIPSTSQMHKAMQIGRGVSPINNDWNGYLDPEHQSSLPSDPIKGYPGSSGGGEVSYAADEEISFGIFAGSGGATVSSDSDGWIFTGSTYRVYDYTAAQLADIDESIAPVYIKDQSGVEHFLKHNGTSVIVTKVGGQLKVETTDAIFAELGITKLWRFFVTERVGRVVELSVESLIEKLQETLKAKRTLKDMTGSRTLGVEYTNTEPYPIKVYASITRATGNSVTPTNEGKSNVLSIDVPTSGATRLPVSMDVQSGKAYSIVSAAGTILTWYELRI